ncbi:hypothetical protein B0H14DRAFT_3503919 [Mycena olivaceomarginata]|jgi:hypothetical protein|nr:hypothetical protein B0H14DRAFT_3503919 [Mycena olivaceomarginata]
MPSTRSLRVRATAASANKGPRTGPKANPSQTDPYPLPHPVVPLVLPSANVPLEELLARVLPDVDAQAREKAFNDMIRSEGSKKAAVALFQSVYNNLIKYPVEGVFSTLPLLQRTKLMSFRPSSPLLASLLGPLI